MGYYFSSSCRILITIGASFISGLSFYRYTFGPALFVAWIGGGVLVVGGILKSLAFREMVKDEKPRYEGGTRKHKPRNQLQQHFAFADLFQI